MPRPIAFAGAVALLLAGLALATTAGGQRRPSAREECAGLGTAADYSVFVREDYTAVNTQLEGRLAAGGNANVSNWAVGVAGSPDSGRLDMIVGGDLAVGGNAQIPNGSATYGGSLSGSLPSPNGTVTRADPPFSFDEEMTAQEVRSDALGRLDANGTVSGPAYGALELVGSDAERNVFTIDATTLQTAQRILIRAPPGSTTVINVTGSAYGSAIDVQLVSVEFWNGSSYQQLGDDPGAELNALRDATLWNFPQATAVQIGPGVAWQGSVLAPHADVRLESNTQLYGQVIGRSLAGSGTVRDRHFAGCLPPVDPEPDPGEELALDSLCVDPVTDTVAVRLRNDSARARRVHWDDRLSAQEGDFTVGAGHDHIFAVEEGSSRHAIVARSGNAAATALTTTRECSGTIRLRKLVTGVGVPDDGRWVVRVKGDSGFSRTVTLTAGRAVDVTVPGQIAEGDVDIGVQPGGYRYVVVETDRQGAATTTVDHTPVTVHDGDVERVTVVNHYERDAPTPPDPDPGPGPGPEPDPGPGPLPIDPVEPPGTPDDGSGTQGIVVDAGGTDLAISERITPSTVRRNGFVTVVTRITNISPVPAVGSVASELPQLDPSNPNATARIVSVRDETRGTTRSDCTARRPVRCSLGTIAPGQTVTVRAATRIVSTHSLRSVVMVSSQTPDVNATNNFDGARVRVAAPRPRVAAAISAPRAVHVGDHFSYRVSAIGTGRAGARSVRFCHRPPAGLLVASAPGAFRVRGGLLCRDVRRLRKGQRASFLVRAVPAARTAGRTLGLRTTAAAPGAPPSRAATPMRVLARAYDGRG